MSTNGYWPNVFTPYVTILVAVLQKEDWISIHFDSDKPLRYCNPFWVEHFDLNLSLINTNSNLYNFNTNF